MLSLGYKKVAIVGRRKELLEAASEKLKEIMGPKGKVLILAKDLTSEKACKEIVEETVQQFGSKELFIHLVKL